MTTASQGVQVYLKSNRESQSSPKESNLNRRFPFLWEMHFSADVF